MAGAGASRVYFKTFKSKHKDFTVREGGLFINPVSPILGASPDGLVNCSCHDPGILEIKCPWSARDLTIKEFAEPKKSFLVNDELGLLPKVLIVSELK